MTSQQPLQIRPVGGELVALAASTLLAVLAGAWFPPAFVWRWWLVGAAVVAGVMGLRRGQRGWWVGCGLLTGAAAVTFAAPDQALRGNQRLVVRFEATVRDGWTPVTFGWRTRIRLHQATVDERPVRHPRELALTVGGSSDPTVLPSAGTRISGLGELRLLEGAAGRRPVLGVKSALVLSQVRPAAGLDALREAGVQALLRAADVDSGRIRAAGLAAALVLGRREGLSEGEVASLRLAGVAHILAVSGLHVGLVAALLWGCLRLLGVRPGVARWVVMAGLGVFALAAGMAPPVRRAAGGAIVYLAARQVGRPLEPLPTVWGVVALLALLEPQVVVEPGFQLSAGVTLALVRWVGPLAERLSLPRGTAVTVAVAVVAQAAAFPLVGAHFGTAAPLAVLTNLVAAPLAVVLVAASVAAVLVVGAWVTPAALLLQVVSFAQRSLAGAAGVSEGAAVGFPSPPTWLALLLLGLGVAAVARWRGAALAGGVGMATSLLWVALPGRGPTGEAEVRLLPVREGMAMLLRSGGSAVLIDTGRHPGEAAEALAALRVRRLTAVVLTHADEDHIGGGEAILRRLRVGQLYMPRAARHDPALASLRRLARTRGVEEGWLTAGQREWLGSIPVEVIWPPRAASLRRNDASLVLRVPVAGATLLVTGDIEKLGEANILAAGWQLRAEILQVPHHGSRTSSTSSFLAAVGPRVALVPTGARPRWNYPSPEVATRLRALPALLLAQRDGHDHLWWNSNKAAWVGAPQAVRVHLVPPEVP